MYAFTQRLFPVPYEWGRLALVVGVAAALVGAGELLLPTEGAVGLLSRAALWLSYPLVLWAARFLTPEERRALSRDAAALGGRCEPAQPARRGATGARGRRRRQGAAGRGSPRRSTRSRGGTRIGGVPEENH